MSAPRNTAKRRPYRRRRKARLDWSEGWRDHFARPQAVAPVAAPPPNPAARVTSQDRAALYAQAASPEAELDAALYALGQAAERWRLPLEREKETQAQIAEHLGGWRWRFEREAPLTGPEGEALGVVDFFSAEIGLALEVKLKGAEREILRQLRRYARDPRVTALALATARPMAPPPAATMPRAVGVTILNLNGGWL